MTIQVITISTCINFVRKASELKLSAATTTNLEKINNCLTAVKKEEEEEEEEEEEKEDNEEEAKET